MVILIKLSNLFVMFLTPYLTVNPLARLSSGSEVIGFMSTWLFDSERVRLKVAVEGFTVEGN